MNNLTKEQLLNIIAAADDVLTALAGTNEDIHRDDSAKMCAAWDNLNDVAAPPEVVKRLAQVALVAERLVNSYIANKGTESEFICCITPSRNSVGTGGVWDDWKALDAALDARRVAFIDSLQDETAAKQVEALARRGKSAE